MNRTEPSFPAVFSIVALLAPVAGAAAADSQPTGDVVSQEIEVRLAEIEVVVTDRRGEAVTGLTREDFEVTQDGRPVDLSHFRAVTEGSEGVAGEAIAPVSETRDAPGSGASGRLNLVIYIDRSYLELGDLRDVREALKGFLRRSLGPDDRTMLVAAAESLELAQQFTSVPELVITRLDSIREKPGGGRFAKEYQSILGDIRRIKNEGNDLDARDPRLLAEGLFSQVRAFSAEVEGEFRRSTAQLGSLIRFIAGLPGRRAVLYVGGRMPAAYSRNLFEAWDDTFGRNSNLTVPDLPDAGGGGSRAADTSEQLAQDGLSFRSLTAATAGAQVENERMVQELAALASANGIVFHTLDAGSLRGSSAVFATPGDATLAGRGGTGSVGPTLAPGSLADRLSSLRGLASGTGGRSFAGSRDFTRALAAIRSDFETYYSLGFAPLAASEERSRIEVRLRDQRQRREKLKVRYQPYLQLKDRDIVAAERTISALLVEEMDNPLRVELTPGEPQASGDGLRVPVSISVPLSRIALVADGRVHSGRLTIFATAGGLAEIGSMKKAVVPVRIANHELLTSLGRRVAYRLELEVPAGPKRIAVTVRDDFRPLASTATASLVAGGSPLPDLGSR